MRAPSCLLAFACLLIALVGCRPSQDECGRLLDHFLDVEGADATEGRFREMSDAMKEALAQQKRQFRASLGGEFVRKCQQQLSRDEIACALKATDEASMDRCEGR